MDGWMDGSTHSLVHEWMDILMYRYGWMDGWMDTSSMMHYPLSLPIICRRQLTDGTIYFLENNPSWISAVVGDDL
jgi:hypothetical protein